MRANHVFDGKVNGTTCERARIQGLEVDGRSDPTTNSLSEPARKSRIGSMNDSIIVTTVTVDRSVTGDQGSTIVPVDDDDSMENVDGIDDSMRRGVVAPQLLPPAVTLGVSSSLKVDRGASKGRDASAARTTAMPESNWLIARRECTRRRPVVREVRPTSTRQLRSKE